VDIGHREGVVDNAAVLSIGTGGYIGGRSLEKITAILNGFALPGRFGKTKD
jgi:hypothetical protein